MSPIRFQPIWRRTLIAVALFTFASWTLIAAMFVAWAPGRGWAATLVSRVARATTAEASATPLAVAAMSGLLLPCGTDNEMSFGDRGDSDGFAWCLMQGNGDVWIEDSSSRREFRGRSGSPLFWFREGTDEFEVRDPAVISQVREAAEPLRDIGHQMGELGGEMGRQGARMGRIGGRMGALSARMALIEARLAQARAAGERHRELDADLRDVRRQLDDVRAQMADVRSEHGDGQRALSHRMSELSARHRDITREVRLKIRAIAARARQQGKAERPHANA